MSILSREGSVLDRPGSAGISVDIDVLLERIRKRPTRTTKGLF